MQGTLMRQSTHRDVVCRAQMSRAHHRTHKRAKAAKGSLWDPHSLPQPAQIAVTLCTITSGTAREDADKTVSVFIGGVFVGKRA